MGNKALLDYLNEFKFELQETYDEFNQEMMADHENDELYHDAYDLVGRQLDDAISGIETLISDLEEGKYDDYGGDDVDYQDYSISE
jgi:hypothetical protein